MSPSNSNLSNTALKERKSESFKIFDQIAKTYDLLNHLLSFGIDIYWRKRLLKLLPGRNGLKVLDLATGTGDLALTLGNDSRVATVRGIDLSRGMVEIGNQKVKKKGLQEKVTLEIGDGVSIPAPDESYDAVTVSFGIRNFNDFKLSLENMHRVLVPGGRAYVMEFSLPKNPLVRAVYFLYFRHILPLVGNLISGHGDAYTYLNKTVEDFPYGDDFLIAMTEAGFVRAESYLLTFGIATIYVGYKEED